MRSAKILKTMLGLMLAGGISVSGQAFAAGKADALPGGASSLQENYQDWLVVCVQQQASQAEAAAEAPAPVTRCAVSQQQSEAQTRQRVLAIELSRSEKGLSGVLLVPFGLALDAGISLQIDEGKAEAPLRVRTCLPAGCVVPLDFDAAKLKALTSAATLKVKAQADGGPERVFSISLKGFADATQRLDALTN